MSLLAQRLVVRTAENDADLTAIKSLRKLCFKVDLDASRGNMTLRRNCDHFDAICKHLMVEDADSGQLLATSRLLLLKSGAEIDQSYSAQFYDLSRLTSHTGRLLELGRFCVDPACTNPDVIRLAWASIAGIVDREGVTFLFGCTSFLGTNPDNYSDCFNYLAQKHLAPSGLAPKKHAENTVPLVSKATSTDGYSALRQMPPLLKSYLSMGGWVSDHAVIDPDMDTIHVFTGLEVDRIPERRKQRLRNLAP